MYAPKAPTKKTGQRRGKNGTFHRGFIYERRTRRTSKKLVRASCMNHDVVARTITENNSYSERTTNIQCRFTVCFCASLDWRLKVLAEIIVVRLCEKMVRHYRCPFRDCINRNWGCVGNAIAASVVSNASVEELKEPLAYLSSHSAAIWRVRGAARHLYALFCRINSRRFSREAARALGLLNPVSR